MYWAPFNGFNHFITRNFWLISFESTFTHELQLTRQCTPLDSKNELFQYWNHNSLLLPDSFLYSCIWKEQWIHTKFKLKERSVSPGFWKSSINVFKEILQMQNSERFLKPTKNCEVVSSLKQYYWICFHY